MGLLIGLLHFHENIWIWFDARTGDVSRMSPKSKWSAPDTNIGSAPAHIIKMNVSLLR